LRPRPPSPALAKPASPWPCAKRGIRLHRSLSHARIAKVIYEGGYRASRTAMDLPVSQALVKVVEDATEGSTVIAPALGGSVPMYIFEDLGLPWIGVPIVNYDNHQHSSDENLRLGHFWRGMEIYGAILADLNW